MHICDGARAGIYGKQTFTGALFCARCWGYKHKQDWDPVLNVILLVETDMKTYAFFGGRSCCVAHTTSPTRDQTHAPCIASMES